MTQQHGISPYCATLPLATLKQMIHVVRDLHLLSQHKAYPHLLPTLNPAASLEIAYDSVLMGYDFHITEDKQAKLIEVNTNAGGLWLANQSHSPNSTPFSNGLTRKLLDSFLQEYRLFAQQSQARPKLIAIIDQSPETQFLYPEMQLFMQLFQQANIRCVIIDPSQITHKNSVLYYQDQAIDLIYNRHCDFYFDSPEMQRIAQAWQDKTVCITPNPRTYGLLADKQRMADWQQNQLITQCLPEKSAQRLQQALTKTHLLRDFTPETLWKQRKQWVFKPLNSYASRGVYVGEKLTKNKFSSFIPQETLVQERIKPSITLGAEGQKFKTDFRIFSYQNTLLALTARLYQGQVTNLRTPNGGFSQVKIQ